MDLSLTPVDLTSSNLQPVKQSINLRVLITSVLIVRITCVCRECNQFATIATTATGTTSSQHDTPLSSWGQPAAATTFIIPAAATTFIIPTAATSFVAAASEDGILHVCHAQHR